VNAGGGGASGGGGKSPWLLKWLAVLKGDNYTTSIIMTLLSGNVTELFDTLPWSHEVYTVSHIQAATYYIV
jgi:hypothetical protein